MKPASAYKPHHRFVGIRASDQQRAESTAARPLLALVTDGLIAIAILIAGLLCPSATQAADLELVLRGTWTPDPSAEVNAVAIQDGLAYVALGGGSEGGEGGLAIIDVRDPSSPRQLSRLDTGGWTRQVAVSGSYAYVVGATIGLGVIDVSDPADPQLVSSYGFDYASVAVKGQYAYVVGTRRNSADTGTIGILEVLDLSNPTQPSPVGVHYTSGNAYGVHVADGMAYVAFGSSSPLVLSGGLSLIDVSDPTSPQHVGSCALGGWASQVMVNGDFAYVAVAGDSGGGVTGGDLQVIDVSDPANPQRISGYGNTGAGAIRVATDADNVYLASAADGALHVIDPDNATSPQRVGRYRAPEYARGMAVAGDFVYLAAGGLHAIELRRANLQRVGTYATGGHSLDVVVFGHFAYLADGSAGLQVVDVTDPARPQWFADLPTGEPAQAVAVAENRVYVGVTWWDPQLDRYRGTLEVIETSSSAVLTRIGMYSVEAEITNVTVVGPFAYISVRDWANDQAIGRLEILEVSDPSNPRRIGAHTTQHPAIRVVVSGTTAYVATGEHADFGSGRLELVDLSDAANPRRIGAFETDKRAESIAVSGNFAYVGANSGGGQAAGARPNHSFEVVDVSDPANPRWVSGWEELGHVHDIQISDGFAYMTGFHFDRFMDVIDVRTPLEPSRVIRHNFGYLNDSMVAMSIDSNHVYVAAGSDGLIILNKYTELRIGPAIVLSDGRVQLQLSGANGQCVRVQRSANLIDWEDWRTVTLDGTGCELIDQTAAASQRFYRAVEDNSGVVK
jgi:hypothetical protein